MIAKVSEEFKKENAKMRTYRATFGGENLRFTAVFSDETEEKWGKGFGEFRIFHSRAEDHHYPEGRYRLRSEIEYVGDRLAKKFAPKWVREISQILRSEKDFYGARRFERK